MSAPFDALEKIFHEPSRLAIMSELSSTSKGKTFAELKEACALTDGNLSRHLTALEKSGAVKIKKAFIGVKPCTTASLTERGRRDFLQYLEALEIVLKEAAKRAKPEIEEVIPAGALKPSRS